MKKKSFPALALFTGALAVVSEPILEEPAFRPEEGSTLEKVFEWEMDFQLDSFSILANGEDMTGMIGDLDMTIRTESTVGVTDEYESVGEGFPTKLKRTFDELASTTTVSFQTSFGGDDQDMEASSELEGKSVRFKWNEDDEEYEVTFDDGESDDELLNGLTEDMDLRAFLPEGDVSKGDTWEIELSELAPLVQPGGNVKLLPENQEMPEDMDLFEEIGEGFKDEFADLFEGECLCTFKEIRDADGVKVAEIGITLEIASAANIADLITEVIEAIGEQMGEAPPVDIETADINFDFDGEGTLLWDLENGRAHAFEIMGEALFAFEVALVVEDAGESQSIEASVELSGTYGQKAEMTD